MRTVLYISMYTGIGGGEIGLLNLMSHLNPAEYRPVLLVPDDGPLASRAVQHGIETIVEPFPAFPLRNLIKPHSFATLMRAGRRVGKLIDRIEPDIVQCSDILTLLLLFPTLLRKRLTIVFSVIFFYEPARIFLLWILDTLCISRIVACSGAVQEHLLDHVPGLKTESQVIYHGVDSERFKPLNAVDRKQARKRFGIPEDALVAGLVARFDTWKGHLTFLHALELLHAEKSNTKILGLTAGGAFTGAVVHQVKAYHEKVIHESVQLRNSGDLLMLEHTNDVELLTGCLDVLVCPSDREAYGLVVLEAFSAGTPVVVSDTVGALEVLPESPFLYIVKSGDPKELAFAIRKAVENPPDEGSKLAMRSAVQGLNWEAFSREFSQVYDAL